MRFCPYCCFLFYTFPHRYIGCCRRRNGDDDDVVADQHHHHHLNIVVYAQCKVRPINGISSSLELILCSIPCLGFLLLLHIIVECKLFDLFTMNWDWVVAVRAYCVRLGAGDILGALRAKRLPSKRHHLAATCSRAAISDACCDHLNLASLCESTSCGHPIKYLMTVQKTSHIVIGCTSNQRSKI